jgi:hypothetical protein
MNTFKLTLITSLLLGAMAAQGMEKLPETPAKTVSALSNEQKTALLECKLFHNLSTEQGTVDTDAMDTCYDNLDKTHLAFIADCINLIQTKKAFNEGLFFYIAYKNIEEIIVTQQKKYEIKLHDIPTLFQTVHYIEAPLILEWILAQQCYKQIKNKLEVHNAEQDSKKKDKDLEVLNKQLTSVLCLGNYCAVAHDWREPAHLVEVPSSQVILNTALSNYSNEEHYKINKEKFNLVTQLQIPDNELRQFKISELKELFPNLHEVYLPYNKIVHLGKEQFHDMANISNIGLHHNPISSIDIDCFDNDQIRQLTRHCTISLQNTHITANQLAALGLTKVKTPLTQAGKFICNPLIRDVLTIAIFLSTFCSSLVSYCEGMPKIFETKFFNQWFDKWICPYRFNRYLLGATILIGMPTVPTVTGFYTTKATLSASLATENLNESDLSFFNLHIIHESGDWKLFTDSAIKRWWQIFKDRYRRPFY